MIEDGFHPCRECGMPMVEEWSNVDGDYLRCTWCGFEREWLGGRKVLRHGNPEKIAAIRSTQQRKKDRGAIAEAYRRGYRAGMLAAIRGEVVKVRQKGTKQCL